MTAPAAPPTEPPSFLASTLALALRHALTAVGGVMVTQGLLQDTGAAQLVAVGVGLAPIIASVIWSVLEKNAKIKAIAALIGQNLSQ